MQKLWKSILFKVIKKFINSEIKFNMDLISCACYFINGDSNLKDKKIKLRFC